MIYWFFTIYLMGNFRFPLIGMIIIVLLWLIAFDIRAFDITVF